MDRLFIAIDIPIDIKNKFIEIIEKLNSLNAKTVAIENIHITIKFIGETTKTNEILKALEKIKFKKFTISLKGVGVFSSIYTPRVFWVGIQENQEIKSLFNIVEENLKTLGIPKDEREFSPHVTLARFKKTPNIEKLKKTLETFNKEFGKFDVKEFVLYKSELTYPNPIYHSIRSFELI